MKFCLYSLELSTFLIVLCLNQSNGLFDFLPSFLWNPFKEIKKPPPRFGTKKDEVISPTKTVSVEDIIFELAPIYQSFFDPSDDRAKRNYVMSPLSTSILMAEYLMGSHGWNHDCIAKLLNLNDKAKREITIFEQIEDPLYDEKVYHGAYHYRLMTLSRNELIDEEQDKFKLSNALFHKKEADFVSHFQTSVDNFYQTNIEAVDFNDVGNSAAAIANMTSNLLGFDVSNESKLESEIIQPSTESILLNTLLFHSTWKFPLTRSKKREIFFAKPFQKQKIFYLEGNLTNTVYVDSNNFTLVGVPLSHKNTLLYILLPKGDQFTNYNIRLFSERFSSFENFENTLETRKVLRNVTLKVPDIFTQFIEFDIMKPLMNYINEENMINGKEFEENVELNKASRDLLLNNMIQHVHFSITNETKSASLKNMTLSAAYRSTKLAPQVEKKYISASDKNISSKSEGLSNDNNRITQPQLTEYTHHQPSRVNIWSQEPQEDVGRSDYMPSNIPTPSSIYQEHDAKSGSQANYGNNPENNWQFSNQDSGSNKRPINYLTRGSPTTFYQNYPDLQDYEYDFVTEKLRFKRYSARSSQSKNAAIDFKVTRPFVFIVRNEDTKLVLLWGSISDPLTLQ